MSNITWKIAKSAAGNVYLAATRWDNGRKVADICLFSGKPFLSSKATKGQLNILSELRALMIQNGIDFHGAGIEVGSERGANIHKFEPFTIAIVDNGLINGVSVPSDGAYLIHENKAYFIN
jgi:hypothetical protein